MSAGKAKVELATLFQASYIVRKHIVEEDDTSERPTFNVRLYIIPLTDNNETTELLKLVRAARNKVPKSYALKFKFEFWM